MKKYANEKSVLMLVSLLKSFNIKRVVASPGTTNLSFVASMQCDPFFEIFSCVDERSAAYMACGMAAETGEPVVITCTGATASRNYLSALTEAYYRKLPILAVTGTQYVGRIGHLHTQLIDRSSIQKDVALLSVNIPALTDNNNLEEFRSVEVDLNRAINELYHRGGGPVHINLQTLYTWDFSVDKLPDVRKIERIGYKDISRFPEINHKRIGIFLGSHNTFSEKETLAIDNFCSSHNAVVFCDHTSGYYGKYKVNFALVASQVKNSSPLLELDLCIHVGEMSAEYGCISNLSKKEVWRVSLDGELRDQFSKLRYVFEITEEDFFNYYSIEGESHSDYLEECLAEYTNTIEKIPELPFSNIWIASMLASNLPDNSCLHLGILNSLRSWNLFTLPKTVTSFANVGGYGIDGGVSSLLGASIITPNKLFFGVIGDLAFFYDINSLGNRHIGNNVRLLIVNNGKGTEFRNFYHVGSTFGEDADKYIAAGGHFGNKSRSLVKNFVEDLGYKYITASSKTEFIECYKLFVDPDYRDKSIVFEVFTDNQDESLALNKMWNISSNINGVLLDKGKNFATAVYKSPIGKTVKQILGAKGISFVKSLLKK